MKHKIKIGNAQAFWGDRTEAASWTLSLDPDIDYMTLDYLAEVSMSIMAIQREKDPEAGYAKDFIEVVKSLIPYWKNGGKCRLITNAGGLHPLACAKECQKILSNAGLKKNIGVVDGDDVLPYIKSGGKITHLENREDLSSIQDKIVSANAYMGAYPIVEALKKHADIVITGRTADPSLTVAPCIFEFGWKDSDWDLIAQATVAGHLIECGTQVTGGISTRWLDLKRYLDIGYPIIEMQENGEFVVTKPKNTGGLVNIEVVKEQLLYEIGDPNRYLSPDATVSFLGISLSQEGEDRVKVVGAKGSAPPDTLKVSITYQNGYKSESTLIVVGPHCIEKGKRIAEVIFHHTLKQGYDIETREVECLGTGVLTINPSHDREDAKECVLRIAVADPSLPDVTCSVAINLAILSRAILIPWYALYVGVSYKRLHISSALVISGSSNEKSTSTSFTIISSLSVSGTSKKGFISGLGQVM